MKIGIITFHQSHNCGSMLQAFALQHVLNELGYKNEIIDFANRGSREIYSILPPIHPFRRGIRGRLKNWICVLPFYFLIKRQSSFYYSFLKDHLTLSAKSYFSNHDLQCAKFNYTHYVCGSDQVWNTRCPDADDSYFLNFVKFGKKIAYAVSMAANRITDFSENISHYKNLLSSFDAISVRETNAIKEIHKLGVTDVQLLLDPTLLLSQKDWENALPIGERIINEEYIFYYAYSYSDEVNKIVKHISEEYNLSVYIMEARILGTTNVRQLGFRLCDKSGPLAFLNLMKYAKLSLTTSFHGTVFSVIFHKPFWFINSSMHSEYDDRASSLLEQVGLPEHLIYGKQLLQQNVMESIDYEIVEKHIYILKNKSKTFLVNALA